MLMFQNHVMDEMCDQAKEEYPLECCGVLLGKREKNMRIVFEIIPIQNTAEPDERKTHFFIQPFEFLRIEKTAVEKELEIVGFYYSPPDYEERASKEDEAHMIFSYSYPIISVRKGRSILVASYENTSQSGFFIQRENLITQED